MVSIAYEFFRFRPHCSNFWFSSKAAAGIHLTRSLLFSSPAPQSVELPGGQLGRLHPGEHHGPENGAHPVGAVQLGHLHATDNQTGHHFPGALDDRVLGAVHVGKKTK